MTTHFKGTFKNKAGGTVVPHCQRFAMSVKWGAVTENKAEVDCVRCAKALGITPAAKEISTTPEGTCQCCFNVQKLPNGKGKLSLHGYTRPGHGYIVGACMGQKELPFEKSCEVTKRMRSMVKDMMVKAEERKGRLERNEVEEILTQVTDYSKPADAYCRRPTKLVTVKRGDEYKREGRETIPSFEQLRTSEIRELGYRIKSMGEHIAFLTEKIEAWVLVP